MQFDGRFHRAFIAGLRYNVRFSIKRTSFVFMHEAVEVARGGAAAGLRKELLMPSADARAVLGRPLQVGVWLAMCHVNANWLSGVLTKGIFSQTFGLHCGG